MSGTLYVTGYLRGIRSLSANQLVHLTGQQDYQVDCITQQTEPRTSAGTADTDVSTHTVLHRADPQRRETLGDLVPINPLAHEQSIITEEVRHTHSYTMVDAGHYQAPALTR